MTYDLTRFDLGDMLKCSLRLREAASGAPTLELSAQRICRFLYEELHSSDIDRACSLVRCYKTHPYGSLDPRHAQSASTATPARMATSIMWNRADANIPLGN